MATQILMPALSPTMTEGTLLRWLKEEGDAIVPGDTLAEIETDKATMEIEAIDTGILGKILVSGGTQNVKVNQPIGLLMVKDEAAPVAAAAVPIFNGDTTTIASIRSTEMRLFASPLARRLARQEGVDLANLVGSGTNRRIVKADVEAALLAAAPRPILLASTLPSPPAAATDKSAVSGPRVGAAISHNLVPHSSMRKVIAKRLSESKQTIPHFYLSVDVELDELLSLRAELNNAAPKEDSPETYKLSVNDLVIKAVALTLRQWPQVNAHWVDDGLIQHTTVDIAIAVALLDGLITPIVRNADQKGLVAISGEVKALSTRARSGRLAPEEFQGGGFSISNLGMYGVKNFAAIVNPPQSGILAVGIGEKRPIVKNSELAIATIMSCTLSVDHRVVDGVVAAQWLNSFKEKIEAPLKLLL